MKMFYKNDSSSLSSILFIPRTDGYGDGEVAITKRESTEFPSISSKIVELKTNEITHPYDSKASVNNNIESNSDIKNSTNDKIKYKTVWMGPAGGYSIMEEYTEPRKCLEIEVPKDLDMELKRFRQLSQYSNRSNSNIANNSGVMVLNDAETMKEDNYMFKSSRSLANISCEKKSSVGPLPYQNKVAVGNRSCLGRDLIPL